MRNINPYEEPRRITNKCNFPNLKSATSRNIRKISSIDSNYYKSPIKENVKSFGNDFRSTISSNIHSMKRTASFSEIFAKFNSQNTLNKEVKSICLENHRLKRKILKGFSKNDENKGTSSKESLKLILKKPNKFRRSTL
jgi:hypothetical protein